MRPTYTVNSGGQGLHVQRSGGVGLKNVHGVGKKQVAKEVGRLPRQLRRHVVDGAHQHPRPLETVTKIYIPPIKREKISPLRFLISVRVVEAEGGVDGGALVHELNGAARVGGNVADGQHAVRQGGRPHRNGQPGRVRRTQQVLGVRNRQQLRTADGPVDSVHNHRRVRRDLRIFF